MKTILISVVFMFLGHYSISQVYIVNVSKLETSHQIYSSCYSANDRVMTTIDPQGNASFECLKGSDNSNYNAENLKKVSLNLNSIIDKGYELILLTDNSGLSFFPIDVTWYLAVPWRASGLEQVSETLNSIKVSPNPANDFVNISLDFTLKGESKIILISEGGYMVHNQSVHDIIKNQEYNIDISKIPAGKYLVTIVNGKSYYTPQKLIVL